MPKVCINSSVLNSTELRILCLSYARMTKNSSTITLDNEQIDFLLPLSERTAEHLSIIANHLMELTIEIQNDHIEHKLPLFTSVVPVCNDSVPYSLILEYDSRITQDLMSFAEY